MCACVQRAPGGRHGGGTGLTSGGASGIGASGIGASGIGASGSRGRPPPHLSSCSVPPLRGDAHACLKRPPPPPLHLPRMGVFAWAAYSTQTKSMVPHYCAAFNTCTRFSCSFFTPPTFPPTHTHTATAFTHGLPPPTPPIPTGMTTPRRSAFS